MGDNGIGLCNWCGESFIIRYGCECKKLASNQDWLEKAGLVKKPKETKDPLRLLTIDERLVVEQMTRSFPGVLYHLYVNEKRRTMKMMIKGHDHNEVFSVLSGHTPLTWVFKTTRDDNIKPHSH